jgi:queuine tRNA-ribosyltransferase
MPVGTIGTVKALTMEEVGATDAGIVLGNTYHLWLRPGAEVVRARRPARFSRWPRAMLTDSGGFQVFSLAKLRTMDDDGVTFRSHIDGSPEAPHARGERAGPVAARQRHRHGARRVPARRRRPRRHRSARWPARPRGPALPRRPRGPRQALFGIVQGGVHEDLRLRHLEDIAAMPFDGIALGGLSVGEPVPDMHRVLNAVAHQMPDERPRYLMGVGTPRDLLVGSLAGIDMFDCVLPTRNARNGQCLTWRGRVNIKQARHRLDDGPLDPLCDGQCCNGAGRALHPRLPAAPVPVRTRFSRRG